MVKNVSMYAVFIAMFDLLEPGMNGENVKLVSLPMLTQVVDVNDGSVSKGSFS